MFSWSVQALSRLGAWMFGRLGIHPGPDISLAAASSLAATGRDQARAVLGELTAAHLLTEHYPGRYSLHDLLRVYAAEQADALVARSAAVPLPAGCWITTCTPSARPACSCTRPGT